MTIIDWCLIDTLFVSECWAQLHVRFHLTKLGKNFHWKDDEESPDLGDWAFNPWSWNPLPEEIRWAVKKKKRERPTEEKVGQDLTSPFWEARPARQAWKRGVLLCKYIVHLPWLKLDCTNCCYKGPHSGIWVISLILFITFNPASSPSSCLPRSTSSSAQQSASTVFPVECAI